MKAQIMIFCPSESTPAPTPQARRAPPRTFRPGLQPLEARISLSSFGLAGGTNMIGTDITGCIRWAGSSGGDDTPTESISRS